MYKINYKNIKKGYVGGLLFLIIGTILLVSFGWLLVLEGPIKKMSMDGEVKAYDVQLSQRRKSATYYYEVNGEKYAYTLVYPTNVGASRMISMDTIYYKSSNPNDAVSECELQIGAEDIFIIIFVAIPVFVGIRRIFNTRKLVKNAKWLSEKGTLIKGLKYQKVCVAKRRNRRKIMAIQVDYELPSGSVIKLTGELRYDLRYHNEDELVDLLIDLDDIDKYYIDFNIN